MATPTVGPSPAPPFPMPQLAYAYLALADADDPPAPQRTLPHILSAAVASLALAIGAPAGYLVLGPADHPVGPLAAKLSLDDE